MQNQDVFGYATNAQINDFLYSLQLFGASDWSKEKQIGALYAISNHIEDHYTLFQVPKRNGSERTICAPSPLLKTVQKRILFAVLSERPVSEFATAYKTGVSILDNAAGHVGQKYVLKLDIENFFGSILFQDVMNFAFPRALFPKRVSALFASLCCYHDCLPQGAPTSACISNIVLKPFDDYIGRVAKEMGAVYTRYSDDMTFSGDFDTKKMYYKAKLFLEAMNFTVNEAKTQILTKKSQQKVTGLVVNEKVQVPKNYRKTVRQEAYFATKYGLTSHLAYRQNIQAAEVTQNAAFHYKLSLLGKINYILLANPEDQEFKKWQNEIKSL
ncbi:MULTISPECIES: reverse transcriptase family protein [Listeria]|uniref:reverse transcriptase family protein n=1 Tax=Listeria TaxID=1637 RepID=UPI000B58EE21|nr:MULTISPECIES: reverse transcriptase family protein [Listeria]